MGVVGAGDLRELDMALAESEGDSGDRRLLRGLSGLRNVAIPAALDGRFDEDSDVGVLGRVARLAGTSGIVAEIDVIVVESAM